MIARSMEFPLSCLKALALLDGIAQSIFANGICVSVVGVVSLLGDDCVSTATYFKNLSYAFIIIFHSAASPRHKLSFNQTSYLCEDK